MMRLGLFLVLFLWCSISASQTTVQDGPWHDSATWDTVPIGIEGEVATVNHRVTIEQDALAYEVVVYGDLVQYGDTEFRVQTVWVEASGYFEQQPRHSLVVRSLPLIRPDQLDRGIINKGRWIAKGTPKTPYARATHGLTAGMTEITLDCDIEGWQPGDLICLPPTQQLNTGVIPHNGTSPDPNTIWPENDERVTVIATNKRTVTVTPLAYDHPGCPDNPWGIERYPHVVNFTRDSKWTSEDPDNPGHTQTTERGCQRTSWVEIDSLGRTRGDIRLDTNNNVIGRYPVHFHLNTGPRVRFFPFNVFGQPNQVPQYQGIVEGVSIRNPRKWAIAVHHSDYMLIKDTVAHGANANFVTEDATEQFNRFEGCVSISPKVGWNALSAGAGETDFGANGAGFWFRSTGNDVVECTAYGGTIGFCWVGYVHPLTFRPYRVARGSEQTQNSRASQYSEEIRDNEAAAVWIGIYEVYPNQWPGAQIDSVRREIANTLLWANHRVGRTTYHSGQFTYRDLAVIFDEAITNTNGMPSGLFGFRQTIGTRTNGSYDVLGDEMYDLKVSGAVIGVIGPIQTNGNRPQQAINVPCLLDGAEISALYGIFFQMQTLASEPTERSHFAVRNVAFLPSGVTRGNPDWFGGTGMDVAAAYDLFEVRPPEEFAEHVQTFDDLRFYPKGDINAPAGAEEVPNEQNPNYYGLINLEPGAK